MKAGPDPTAGAPRPVARAGTRTGRWVLLAAALGAAAGTAWLTYQWRSAQAHRRLLNELPPLPDLTGKPAVLIARLQAAHTAVQAQDAAQARAGLEQLGRLLHANGFVAEAAWCWQRLAEAQPSDATWPYYAADAAEALGDYAAMEHALRATLERAPDYAPAWLRLADRLFKTGRTTEATAAYQQRLSLVPGDPYSRLGLARVEQQLGHTGSTRQQLETIVRDHPQFGPAHNLLAKVLTAEGLESAARRERWLGQNSGRFAEAPDPWREDLNTACLEPEKLIMLGTIDFQLGRGDRGRGRFEQAVQLAPDVAAYRALLGDLEVKLGDLAAARATLERALDMAPQGERVIASYLNLAEACRGLNQPQAALAALDRARAQQGDTFELLNSRGVTLTQLGQREAARQAYLAALALNPNDADTNFNVGIALLNDGQEATALDHFRRALTLRPTYLPALTMLVRVPMSAGRLSEAKAPLDQLFDAYSGVPQVRDLAGRWYDAAIKAAQAAGDIAQAQAWRQEARDRLAL